MGKSRRRGFKSWFVEPYKQVRLGLMFLLLNFAFSFLILGVFGYYVWDIYEAVATYFQLTGQESVITLQKFSIPIVIGAGLIVLFVITTILVSVRYTHGIYGPLVSINRYLDDIIEGRRPQLIQLRESDQLQELARKLNSLAERFASDQRSGVMVAIHRFLDEANANKKPDAIRLREDDHFLDLANKLNQLRDRL